MCDPMWALASVAGVGTLMSSSAASAQVSSQQSAAETQARIAENNAAISRIQADESLATARVDEANQRAQTRSLKGTQRAALAANGVSLGEGSALDLLTTTDYMGELDALTIRDNAAKQAWGYNIQAENYLANSNLLNQSASEMDPSKAGATSLLTGATQVAGSLFSKGAFGGSSAGKVVRGVALPGWPT